MILTSLVDLQIDRGTVTDQLLQWNNTSKRFEITTTITGITLGSLWTLEDDGDWTGDSDLNMSDNNKTLVIDSSGELLIRDDNGVEWVEINPSGSLIKFGNSEDDPDFEFFGSGVVKIGGKLEVDTIGVSTDTDLIELETGIVTINGRLLIDAVAGTNILTKIQSSTGGCVNHTNFKRDVDGVGADGDGSRLRFQHTETDGLSQLADICASRGSVRTDGILEFFIYDTGASNLRLAIDKDGLYLGDGGTTDFSKFETSGFLEFNGDAIAWDDRQVSLGEVRQGASSPDWEDYRGGQALAFHPSQDNQIRFNAQLAHKYKLNTDIEFHIHIAYPDNGAGNSLWTLTYSWSNIGGQFPVETTATTKTVVSPEEANHHQLAEIVATIDASGADQGSISSVLICSLTREGTDDLDTYGSDAYLVSVDFHHQIDTVGSRLQNTK